MSEPDRVVIAPPTDLQRPGCPGGTPVLMADGQFWLVPVPGPGWSVPGVDADSLAAAARFYADDRGHAPRFARLLLSANYDLDADADESGAPSPHLLRTLDAMLADQAAHAAAELEPKPLDGAHAATDAPAGDA